MNYKALKEYQKHVSRRDILDFSYCFQFALINELKKQFNLIPIDAPLITKYRDSDINVTIGKSRSIAFDSDIEHLFLKIPTNYDMERVLLLDDYEVEVNEGIIYSTPVLMRDALLNNLRSMKWTQIEMELSLEESNNKTFDYLKGFLAKISDSLVIALTKTNHFSKIKSKKDFNLIKLVTETELKKKFGLVSKKDRDYLEAQESEVFFSCNDYRAGESPDGETFYYNPQTHRRLLSSRLFANFELLGTHASLAEVAFSCDYQEQLEQVSAFMNPENDSYSKYLRNNSKKNSIAIKFYLPRIVMYLLDLCHIGETTKSIWEDDFKSFTKKKKIDIL